MREQGTVEQPNPHELTLEDALAMFEGAKKYTDTGHRTNWDNYFKVYKGKRVKRDYEGIADPNIRESHTIIETLVANIAGGNPKFHFIPTNEEQSKETDVLNGQLDYYMLCNSMGLKNQEWVREMLLYGTAILHVTWKNGLAWIENIPLRDFFVDPASTGLVKTNNPARYAGFEYLADKSVLAQTEIYNEKEDKMVKKYKNLDIIGVDTEVNQGGQGNGNHKAMDKAFKDMFNGSTLGESAVTRQIHVILMYDLTSGKIVEIGNKKDFIYYEESHLQRDEITKEVDVDVSDPQDPTGMTLKTIKSTRKLDAIRPFLPFAVLRDYVDSSQFYGDGEMAVIMGDAELLNDYEAMDVDNNAYQNTPMYWIDPQFADMAPEIETIPGAVYPIPKGAMGALERPQLSGDLDMKKQRIQERMRSATAADENMQGIAQDKGRITATEVSTNISQSQNRYSTKIENLENEGYSQLGSVIFKFMQLMLTTSTVIRVVGPMGIEFKDYDPYDFNGEYEPHVELDTTIKQKQLEVGQKDNQIYQQLSEDPHGVFNPIEVKRFIIQHIDPTVTDEKFNGMLAQDKGPSASEQLQQAQMDMELKKAEYNGLAMIYGDKATTPFILSQIEQYFGLSPDPFHEAQEHTEAIAMGARHADLLNPMTDANGKPDPMMPAPQPAQATPGADGATPVQPPQPPMPTPAAPPEGMPGMVQ